MIIYAGIMTALTMLGAMVNVQQDGKVLAAFLSVCLQVPIYGRVFGWW